MAPKRISRQTEPGQAELLPYPEASPSAYRLMWIGVAGFSVLIAVIWGWSLKVQVASFRWDKSSERELIEKTKTNWDTAFNTPNPAPPVTTQASPPPNTKQQVLEVLRKLMVSGTAVAASSSTSTSSSSSKLK